MSCLDIVCPYAEKDKDRLMILWDSLDKFLKVKDFRLFLVSPDGSKPIKSSKVIALKESDVSPVLSEKDFSYFGWWKQQIIKLQSYKFCKTQSILSLDCDCFLNKPLYLKDLLSANKKIKINISENGSWTNWYEGSFTILKLKNLNHTGLNRVGVTPFVFSKNILERLDNYLSTLYKNRHIEFMLSNTEKTKIYSHESHTWSEYCLYHTYAHTTGILNKYHSIDHDFLLYGNCVWNEKENETWDIRQSFATDTQHFFTVVQSVSNYPVKTLKKDLEFYLSS